MKKILIVFGTRPEAIKLAPVIRKLKAQSSPEEWPSPRLNRKNKNIQQGKDSTGQARLKAVVCVTAQHRQMLDQVLQLFEIVPDYDLDIMSSNQDLFDITNKSLEGLRRVLEKERPDLILVQGDTTTTFVASLAAFYLKIPIGHVEAGLRTYNKYQPFPEEKNRHMTTVLADYHFAPTELARNNLIKENISEDRIWVTGNTSIDALLLVSSRQKAVSSKQYWHKYFEEKWGLTLPTDTETGTGTDNSKLILVTGHRRENFGEGFTNICLALREIAVRNPDVKLVYPVHLNPNVRKPVFEILGSNQINPEKIDNIYLIEPLEYAPFVYLMNKSYLILTDSGGIQEEAPSLKKPVLVMRETTERPEGIDVGGTKLVGTDYEKIVSEAQKLLDDRESYQKMTSIKNPFGDGKAASRIVEILRKSLDIGNDSYS